ncbi:hypothetical protein RI054_38g141390 [Pseudoscourfieldia marina]
MTPTSLVLALALIFSVLHTTFAAFCDIPDAVKDIAKPVSNVEQWRALTHGAHAAYEPGIDVVLVTYEVDGSPTSQELTCDAVDSAQRKVYETLTTVIDRLAPIARLWSVHATVPWSSIGKDEGEDSLLKLPEDKQAAWRMLDNVLAEAGIDELPAVVVIGEPDEYNPFTGRAPRLLEAVPLDKVGDANAACNFISSFVNPKLLKRPGMEGIANNKGKHNMPTSAPGEMGDASLSTVSIGEVLDEGLPYALLTFSNSQASLLAAKLLASRTRGFMHVAQYSHDDVAVRNVFGLPHLEDFMPPQAILVNVTEGGALVGVLHGNDTNTWERKVVVASTKGKEMSDAMVVVTELKANAIDSFMQQHNVDITYMSAQTTSDVDVDNDGDEGADDDRDFFAVGEDDNEAAKSSTKTKKKIQKKLPKKKRRKGEKLKLKRTDGSQGTTQFEPGMAVMTARDVQLDILSTSTPAIIILASSKGGKVVDDEITLWAELIIELKGDIRFAWIDTDNEEDNDLMMERVDEAAMTAKHPITPHVHVLMHATAIAPLLPLGCEIETTAVMAAFAQTINTFTGDLDLISNDAQMLEAMEKCEDEYSIIVATVTGRNKPPDAFRVILDSIAEEYALELKHINGASPTLLHRFQKDLDAGGVVAVLPSGKLEKYRGAYVKAHISRWARDLSVRRRERLY